MLPPRLSVFLRVLRVKPFPSLQMEITCRIVPGAVLPAGDVHGGELGRLARDGDRAGAQAGPRDQAGDAPGRAGELRVDGSRRRSELRHARRPAGRALSRLREGPGPAIAKWRAGRRLRRDARLVLAQPRPRPVTVTLRTRGEYTELKEIK